MRVQRKRRRQRDFLKDAIQLTMLFLVFFSGWLRGDVAVAPSSQFTSPLRSARSPPPYTESNHAERNEKMCGSRCSSSQMEAEAIIAKTDRQQGRHVKKKEERRLARVEWMPGLATGTVCVRSHADKLG